MGNFLGNPKNIFWEAFLLTAIVFVLGIFLGLALENSRVDDINEYYVGSEIALMDILSLNNVISLGNASCDELIHANIKFADRIYEESIILDDYGEANKLADNIKLVYKRYDLLRTLLWISSSNSQKQCEGDFSIVVYLYERSTEDLAQRATQSVWSKVLFDLKEKQGSNIILIPIAVDQDLSSLDTLIAQYKVGSFPAVIINEKVINELTTVEELEKYLK